MAKNDILKTLEKTLSQDLHMQHVSNGLGFEDYIPYLKGTYLPQRNVGLRKFSILTSIEKPRLKKILQGTEYATNDEVDKLRAAVESIESKYKRFK
jgi:hypothetical protein